MKIIRLICRVLLGLTFFVFGFNYFLKFMPVPPPTGEAAQRFMGALSSSGYLTAIKVLEILGGALVLSGRFTALGLLILGPIVVNICLYNLFMDPKGLAFGIGLSLLLLVLLGTHRQQFSPLFRPPGGAK